MLLQEMTWPEVGGLPAETPVVFPVAALEQHGRHMPLFTDSLNTVRHEICAFFLTVLGVCQDGRKAWCSPRFRFS